MSAPYDLIVVGGGGMGSATCRHAAARGARVLCIERFALGHDKGSSHGWSRVIREAYFEHPDYVPLLTRTRTLWSALEESTGIRCVHRVGMLYIGAADGPVVRGARLAAERHNIPHEILDHTQLAARYPQFKVSDSKLGLFEPGAGFAIPERSIEAHLSAAQTDGATVWPGTEVFSLSESTNSVHLETSRGAVQGRRVVVAAGAWTSSLLPALASFLKVERQQLVWFVPRDEAACTANTMPVWGIDDDRGGLHYGVPLVSRAEHPGPFAVKVAWHGNSGDIIADPDRVNRNVTDEERERFQRDTERWVPAVAGTMIAAKTCLYTNSPDGHFILDRAPGLNNTFVACGFSGHGFKFVPVVGEIMTDLALEDRTELPMDFLRLTRFQR